MNSIRTLLGLLIVVAMVSFGCGGKHENPLAPSSTMSSYAQVTTNNQGDTIPLVVMDDEVKALAKPVAGKTVDIHTAKVIIRLLRDAQRGLLAGGVVAHEVSFSRMVAGINRNFASLGRINPDIGTVEVTITDADHRFPAGVGGYYQVKVVYLGDRRSEYHWGSVPIRSGQMHQLDIEIGAQARLSYVGYIYLEDEGSRNVQPRIENMGPYRLAEEGFALSVAVVNPAGKSIAGADIRIHYESSMLSILGINGQPPGFSLAFNSSTPGEIKVTMSSATEVNREWFRLFWLDYMGTGKKGSTTVTFEVTFRNVNGKEMVTRTVFWVFKT